MHSRLGPIQFVSCSSSTAKRGFAEEFNSVLFLNLDFSEKKGDS